MAIETLVISPLPGGDTVNGDLRAIQENDALSVFPGTPDILVGKAEGKVRFAWAGFFRFETLIPAGATITSVKLVLFSDGVFFQTLTKMVGGFLRPQAHPSSLNWQLPNGFGLWAVDTDVAFLEWADGASSDVTVMWNNAPAFDNQAMTTQPTNQADWSLGEGLAPFNTVPGLVAQLQSYLDDSSVQALRGTGNTPGAIPIGFQLFERWIAGSGGGSQGLYASDFGDVLYRPKLVIEWTPANLPPVVTILSPAFPVVTHCLAPVDFDATSIDPEDGDISSGVVWTSDLDGVLFTGASFSTSALSVGVHVITATSTDSGALIGIDTIGVTITEAFVIVEAGGNAVRRLVEAGGNAVRRLTEIGGKVPRTTIEAGGDAVRRLTEPGGNVTRTTVEAGGNVDVGEKCS